ncbi:MAG: redox-sensing transcriptional repressor Rex [Ruminococcaceae bacterium]|nr:redox-sensing transcriptional repressor Rex [Oscillospiraceae bacterium]
MNEDIFNKEIIDRVENVSPAVIRRLPRYYRYLRELIRAGQSRISSGELSKLMNVTASQIRQDLNCFGGFGQQGYGYNVNYLFAKISEILGVADNFSAIIIGAGNLGRALVGTRMFERRGVDVVAMFDISDEVIGKEFGGVKVYDMKDLKDFCSDKRIDIAVLALPKEVADDEVERLSAAGIKGIWNFTGKEIKTGRNMVFEDVYLGDSLMTLCYGVREKNIKDKKK